MSSGLVIAIAVNVLLVAFVMVDSARRDFADAPIGPGGWIVLTLLLGPVAVPFYLVLRRRARRWPSAGERRCPTCAEDVRAEAAVCRFCGHQFA